MTDAIREMPTELVPPIPPPGPEGAAEIDAALPEAAAADALVPAPDPADNDAEAAAPPADAPALPEIEYPIGSTRQAILDHFIDSEGDQSMSQIKAALPHVVPTTVEASVRREWEAGRLLRISPGIYRLAPAKPAEQPKSPKPPPPQPEEEAVWFDALERWAVDPASWNTEQFGPPPNQPNNIPQDIKLRFNDRVRKRAERRREAEAAAAKRTAADAELRDKLIAATGGNIVRTSALDDVGPIKLALQVVPIDRILSAIRYQTDRKLYPKNEPARSWGEPRLLKAIAESIVPSLVAAWAAAGKAPATKAPSSAPADDMPDDIDELRGRHDAEDAPAGPHVMSQPAADASEAPAAVSAPAEPESAPASSPPQLDDGPATALATDAPSAEQDPDTRPDTATEGRAQILQAFRRNGAPPQPAPPQPRAVERPWFSGPEAPQPKSDMTDEAYRFVLEGYVAGTVAWAAKHGPPPGSEGCKVPLRILREFKL